ncbi:MAG: FkbM family methyltransferase [bacterium]
MESVKNRRYSKAIQKELLERYNINIIFDIGANIGQYALELRDIGYKGKIVSFEPLSAAYTILHRKTMKDKKWVAINLAIGDVDSESEINVSENLQSSSLLEMLPSHKKSFPKSVYIGKEKIKIRKIDSILNQYCQKKDRLFIKMDAQGYEKLIIEGASHSIISILGIQLEMSFMPLYQNELTFWQMKSFLEKCGFTLMSVEPGVRDPKTGEMLQIEGIFYRLLSKCRI